MEFKPQFGKREANFKENKKNYTLHSKLGLSFEVCKLRYVKKITKII